MIKKRGGMRRRVTILASAPGSIADLARGLWQRDSGARWPAFTIGDASKAPTTLPESESKNLCPSGNFKTKNSSPPGSLVSIVVDSHDFRS